MQGRSLMQASRPLGVQSRAGVPAKASRTRRIIGLQSTRSEQEAFLSSAHTAMLTTLRRDGCPVTLPVWFAWADGCMFVGTPEGSAKMRRIHRDDRCCVLVESGCAWTDLAAVEFAARTVPLAPGAPADAAKKLLDEKYADSSLRGSGCRTRSCSTMRRRSTSG